MDGFEGLPHSGQGTFSSWLFQASASVPKTSRSACLYSSRSRSRSFRYAPRNGSCRCHSPLRFPRIVARGLVPGSLSLILLPLCKVGGVTA